MVRPDGAGALRLPLRDSFAPRFSPDGRRLAVNVDFPDGIAVGYPDGSGFRYVSRVSDGWHDTPDWSPSSDEIVFAFHKLDRAPKLIRLSIQTGERRTLGSGTGPKWSPDDRWIAFTDEGELGKSQSRVMITRPDGHGRRTLTRCADVSDVCATERWSADGRSVVFRDSRLYAVNIATRKVTPIREPNSGLISPDRRLRATGGHSGVYVARRDGSHRHRILGPPDRWHAFEYRLGDWQHVP